METEQSRIEAAGRAEGDEGRGEGRNYTFE